MNEAVQTSTFRNVIAEAEAMSSLWILDQAPGEMLERSEHQSASRS